jgi:hypothetical protein
MSTNENDDNDSIVDDDEEAVMMQDDDDAEEFAVSPVEAAAARFLEKERSKLTNKLEAISEELDALEEFDKKLDHLLEMPFGLADQQARRDMLLKFKDAAQLEIERCKLSNEFDTISDHPAGLQVFKKKLEDQLKMPFSLDQQEKREMLVGFRAMARYLLKQLAKAGPSETNESGRVEDVWFEVKEQSLSIPFFKFICRS